MRRYLNVSPEMHVSASGDVAAAAQAIGAGGVVEVPTETVTALSASAVRPVGLDRLWSMKRGVRRGALAWHIASTQPLLELTDRPVHRRLIERLAPGPVGFALALGEARLDDVLGALGVARGVVDDAGRLLVRVPSHPVARSLLAAVDEPLVMARLSRDGNAPVNADVRLAGPPAPLGRPSTMLLLQDDGGYDVLREGVIEERFISKQLTRTVLFVCTGNTCRSPMAAALARHVLSESSPALETKILSAGTTAMDGMPATIEAVRAVQSLGGSLEGHGSRLLTRDLIGQADVIFAMTRSHAATVQAMDSSVGDRLHLLDPSGEDVPDPIGGPQPLYDATAARLAELVRTRLAELDS
jgi:protein-tyrosine-phosphatase/tRNA A37 threonylcarbamoyladenosine synthetase subunit TsaC/SUA5/YrdC